MTYDSSAPGGAGVGRTGGACDPLALPVASIGTYAANGGGGTPLPAARNMILDSEFAQVAPARVNAATPTTGVSAGVASWQGGTWRAVDARTPVGHRALEVTTTAASSQGVIVYPTTASPISGQTPLAGGDLRTASAYVKAPKGQQMVLTLRIVTSTRGWVAEYPKVFTGTGSWQRVSMTWVVDGTATGSYAALAVGTKIPTAAGITFRVCGPQVEAAWAPTAYEATN